MGKFAKSSFRGPEGMFYDYNKGLVGTCASMCGSVCVCVYVW